MKLMETVIGVKTVCRLSSTGKPAIEVLQAVRHSDGYRDDRIVALSVWPIDMKKVQQALNETLQTVGQQIEIEI